MKVNENVYIDGYKSFDDWGLFLKSKRISDPVPVIKRVTVPARNGAIDYTDLVKGQPTYQDRTITMVFRLDGVDFNDVEHRVSIIRNAIQGRKVEIIFDNDISFYWLGRIEVGDWSPEYSGLNPSIEIPMTAIVDPYKYCVTTSAEDWLWNPFDFEYGLVNEAFNIKVPARMNKTIVISTIDDDRITSPVVISDTTGLKLDVTSNPTPDTTRVWLTNYDVKQGSYVLYDVEMVENTDYTFTFFNPKSEDATVSINYLGGML